MPAARGRVGEPVDQAEHGAGDQQGARDVEPGLDPGRLPLQQLRAADECHPGQDQVHIHHFLLLVFAASRAEASCCRPLALAERYAEASRAVLRTVASGEGW